MKLTNEQVRTKILERLDGSNLELIDFEYQRYKYCSITTKCKECGTIKKYKTFSYIKKPTCPTCEFEKHKTKVFQIAKNYNVVYDFRMENPQHYKWLKHNKLLKEACSHMSYKGGNIERLIYVYEIYIEGIKPHAYIGLTYNLDARDKQHLHGGENDSLWRFCKEHNVAIPKPKILTDYIPKDEASRMEVFYEKEYRERGFETINVAKCGNLGGGTSHTFEEIEAIGKKYSSKKEWEKNENSSIAYARNHYKNINGKNVRWVDLIIPNKVERRKPVIGYNPKTKETRLYESIGATEKDGFDHTKVCSVCRGKYDTHKGWIFRYIVDGEVENVA